MVEGVALAKHRFLGRKVGKRMDWEGGCVNAVQPSGRMRRAVRSLMRAEITEKYLGVTDARCPCWTS